jgi:hypothetical protein
VLGRRLDVAGTITAKNATGQVLWKFHDDFRYFYNCKIIESIPYNSVYGSDYGWFWEYDRTLINTRTGVGAKYGTVEGQGQLSQRMCFFGGCQTLNSASPDIRYNIDYLGNVRAVAHG